MKVEKKLSRSASSPSRKSEKTSGTTKVSKISRGYKSAPVSRRKKVLKPDTSSQKEAEEVMVSSTPSVRLLEKAEIFRLWYQNELPSYFVSTAKVAGYFFIASGVIISSFIYLIDKNNQNLMAAVVCGKQECNQVNDNDLPASAPLVTFLNSLPSELMADTDIVLKVENSDQVDVLLKNTTNGELIELKSVETIELNQYRYIVPYSKLTSASYLMSAIISSSSSIYKFEGPTFSVNKVSELEHLSQVVETDISTTTESLIRDLEVLGASTSEQITNETLTQSIATTTSVTEPALIPANSSQTVFLSLNSFNESTFLKVNTGDILPSRVEIYARTMTSEQPLFLGLATLVQGDWIFSLSALDLPSISLLLYASLQVEEEIFQTEGVLYFPTTAISNAQLTESDGEILNSKIIFALQNSDYNILNRMNYLSSFSTTSEGFTKSSPEESFADINLLNYSNKLIDENKDSINANLEHYASAVQVGSKYLIDLANNALTSQYKLLIEDSETLGFEKTFVPLMDALLKRRFETLKHNLTQYENGISETTNNLTNIDSDADGFSDFDEGTIYQSSIASPDSDSDSIIDSVEIITNFDALNPDVISFGRKNTFNEETIHDDFISIESVSPLIVKNQEINKDEVYAVVQGRSIPNTFVTIFSYNSGILGIIKSNSVGDFSYTLEKSLEEGSQTIVAFHADNEGNVVLSSKPYNFKRTNNNFIAAAVSSRPTFFTQEITADLDLSSTVTAAVAVVAFGFILLLLAQSVRTRKIISSVVSK